MGGRDTGRRLLVGLASLCLLAGCGAGASPTPPPASPTATSVPSAAVATPSPTPTKTPVTYGPVTVVTGTATCPTADLGPSATDGNGVIHYRSGTFICTMTTDDPRVSGTETTSTWSADWWGDPDMSKGALVQWAPMRLENDGGAWEGTLSGVYSSDRGDIIAIWYKGTGGYTGLSYFELLTGRGPWTIQGQISPGDPPTPTIAQVVETVTPPPAATSNPTAASSPLSYGPVTVVEGSERRAGTWGDFGLVSTDAAGVKHYRGTGSWLHATNDPRVSGADVTDLNMDGWERPSHGAAIQWGSTRLTNSEGSWTGTFSGVFDSVHGDAFVIWYSGSGNYAGLTYFVLGTGAGGDVIRLQGLIYPGTPPQP